MNHVNEIKWINIYDYFLTNKNTLNNISKDECNDLLKSACMFLVDDYSIDLKCKAITVLYEISFLDYITLEECWQIYWIITRNTFSDSNIRLLNGNLRSLYHHIYNNIESKIDIDLPYHPIKERNSNLIIIVVSQFISHLHSATLRVLDYSYALKKYLHKDVIIINSSEMNFIKNENLDINFYFHYTPEYSSLTSISYKDVTFEFYQVSSLMPNIDVYQSLINVIYDINPLLVYNIGASNVLTDLCTNFTTTVSLPCSYQIPISCSKYLLVGRKINKSDQLTLSQISNNQHIIETEMNFNITKNDIIYSKDDFNLPSNVFLACIVGNRLDNEIDDKFISLISKLINNTTISFIFIGNISNKIQMINNISVEYQNRLHFLGKQENASEIIKLTNLYINPNRAGGGRSSFEALSHGIPVVTLNCGDVYYVCGDDFSVLDYKEMYSTIINYYNNTEFQKTMSQLAYNRSLSLSDTVGTQNMLISKIIESELLDKL